MVNPIPTCLPQIFACAMRVTQLDGSGVPQPGANMMYSTDAFTQIQWTPVYEDGDEVKQKNACGTICIDVKSPPSFVRVDVQITLCTPDPQLVQLLGGGPVLNIVADGRVGGSAPPIGVISAAQQNGVGIEVWGKQYRSGVPDPQYPYAWWVWPKITNLKMGQFNQENGPNLPVITGEAYENTNWFNGPLNNWPGTDDRVYQWLPATAATLPTIQCGYQTVAST